eukprot:scaffold178850_cov30-Prasinocladus_malaysianus.AAC.1
MASAALNTGLRSTLGPVRRSLLGNSRAGAPQGQLQKRFMAAEPGEAPRVNMWEAPSEISRWKEEHIVLFVLGSWGVVITGAMKIFGGKKEEPAK